MTKSTNSKKTATAKRAPAKAKPAPRRASRKASAKADTADRIKTVVGTRSGNGIFVEAEGGKHVVVAEYQQSAQTNKLAQVGASLAALQAHLNTIAKPSARLAHGVDSRNAPHSAKAVADAKAATTKGRKARGGVATAKPAKAKRAGGNGRGYDAAAKLTTLVKPKDSGLAPGSGRMAKLVFAAKCKTVGAFLGQVVTDDNGKEHKCDAGALSGMLKREHVRIG